MSDRAPLHVPLFRAALLAVLLGTMVLVVLATPWALWVAETDFFVLAPVREVLAVLEQAAAP